MPEPPHTVELRVGGERYGGFTGGAVTQTLESMASTFRLDYVDHWAEDGEPWPLEEGDACAFLVDGETLLEGYIDDAVARYDALAWSLAVSGRSKLGDLVDCAAEVKQWRNRDMREIVEDLTEPFDVTVKIDAPGDAFRRMKVEQGETVADVIARAARLRGFLATDEAGALVLARPASGSPVGTLRRGVNILEGERRGSWRERFSEYRFRGQTQANDELNGVSASQLRGVVDDLQVTRYRPTIVVSGGQSGEKDLGKRAVLERNRRAGRSERIRYQVDGFTADDGELWRPGQLVNVEDDWLRVDATLIVVTVSMSFGVDDSMVTDLELTRPEAFSEIDYPVRARGESWRS